MESSNGKCPGWAVIAWALISCGTIARAEGDLTIENITVEQRPFSSLVDVTCDLHTVNGDPVAVSLWFSTDEGATFPYRCQAVTGDVGENVEPGLCRHIVWDAGVDCPGLCCGTCQLRVTADDGTSASEWVNVSEIAHSPGSEGGCDSLMVLLDLDDFARTVEIALEYKVTATEGAHPTVDTDWIALVDSTGHTLSAGDHEVFDIDLFTAKGDTVEVRAHVYEDGVEIATPVETYVSGADYWRWWNHAFAFCFTTDDGRGVTLARQDSLSRALGIGTTAFVNPFYAQYYTEHGFGNQATPAEIQAYHEGGALDIQAHSYSHGNLGVLAASDTLSATNWGDFRDDYVGDFSMYNLWAYLSTDPNHLGYIYRYEPGYEITRSDRTYLDYFMAEIERDSMTTVLGVPVADVTTFAYPSHDHSPEMLDYLEAEGYLGARDGSPNQSSKWHGLTASPYNQWGCMSLYRMPVELSGAIFGDHPDEAEAKDRVRSGIAASNAVRRGGALSILSHALDPAETFNTYWIRPEEVQWMTEVVADSGGVCVSFDEMVRYYRERATHSHECNGGDKVFTTGE